MKEIRVKCPAKINLTLEVLNKRDDGFHNIKSIMQTVSLYDVLNIKINSSPIRKIKLSGNSTEIPYDEKNLVYRACELFLNECGYDNISVEIFIEKNIPISAGLAGGSTDASGTLAGLNALFSNILSREKLHEMCSKMGSDLNVCLEGGCLLATSRGEKIQKLKPVNSAVTLIKPKYLGISAKEAYQKYELLKDKAPCDMTEKMLDAIENGKDIKNFLYNDLERAVFADYRELSFIKNKLPHSIMSGSGSTYFVLDKKINTDFSDEYEVYGGLEFTSKGVTEI